MLPISGQHLKFIITAIALMIFVLDQVRRRRLREEYSWLWLGAATIYLLIAILPAMSRWVAKVLDTENIALAFTFIGLLFIALILIQYSVHLSELTTQVKDLAQEIALLEQEKDKLQDALGEDSRDQDSFQPHQDLVQNPTLSQIADASKIELEPAAD